MLNFNLFLIFSSVLLWAVGAWRVFPLPETSMVPTGSRPAIIATPVLHRVQSTIPYKLLPASVTVKPSVVSYPVSFTSDIVPLATAG